MANKKTLLICPKPFNDESLAGYILRLTERNFYEKISHIYIMSDLWETVKGRSSNGNLLSPLKVNMNNLCELINCSIDNIQKLSFATSNVDYTYPFQFNNQPIHREAIHTTKTKICPNCLAEEAYHRKAWDLVPVTVCIKHKKILVDHCNSCKKEISWSRTKILECSCGQLLTEIPTRRVSIPETLISSLFYNKAPKRLSLSNGNPLINLGFFDLYEVLVFFSWFLKKSSNWKLRNKYIGKSLNNEEVHRLFSEVSVIFKKWPINFLKLLDNIHESSLKVEGDTSIENHFGYFYTSIYRHLNRTNTRFILEEFDDYLAKNWDGGYIAVLKSSSSKNLNKKYISAKEVYEIYGISADIVKDYINKGVFRGVIKKRGQATLILVEKKSVERHKEKMENTISTQETSEILDIYDRSVHILQRYKCIEAFRGPQLDGYPHWRFSKETVYGLLEEIDKKTLTFNNENVEKEIITFRIALQTAGSYKFGIGELVQGIINNHIRPVRLGKGNGLNQYEFLREDIREYFLKLRAYADKEYILMIEMVKTLGVKRENIADWMKKGFLSYEVGNTEEFKSKRQEFDSFINTYIPLSIVAKELNTNSGSLYQKLLSKNIVALTGPRIDGGKQYLYDKFKIDSYLEAIGFKKITLINK